MPVEDDNVDLVRRAYAAFSAGDADTLTEVFASDVVHVLPGSSSMAGSHKGIQNVLTLYGRLAEMSAGSMRVQLEDVLSDGGNRVISVHQAAAQREGKTLETRECLLITIEDGKIIELQDFFSDVERHDEFWT